MEGLHEVVGFLLLVAACCGTYLVGEERAHMAFLNQADLYGVMASHLDV